MLTNPDTVSNTNFTSFLNTVINGCEKNQSFNVQTFGEPDSALLLFPENGIRLVQEWADATQYEQQFRAMSAREQLAVRQWTATYSDEGHFSDGKLNLCDQDEVMINYELNSKLASGCYLEPEEREMSVNLCSALRKLSPVPGEYLRVAEYRDSSEVPWGNKIHVGDIVTNYPCFMSASSDVDYAAETVDGQVLSSETRVLAFYKIERAITAIPLWRGTASLADECEFLFPRESCFLVKGVSLAQATEKTFPLLRIGILLEQVAAGDQLKNIYTGQTVRLEAE